MSELVNVNGRITPPSEAAVSPLDRGFLYGDSVYETIRTYAGRPFRLASHLDRLRSSAEKLEIPHERAPVDPAAAVALTLERAANAESAVRVILTRGVGPVGYDPEACGPPTVVVHVRPCPPLPVSWLREGVDVAVVDITRNAATAIDPSMKAGNLLNNFLAWRAGRRLGVFEPLLLNPEGLLTEGASSNVFLVHGSRLRTPGLGAGLLRGITRDIVLELALRDGIDASEAALRQEDLRDADELFLTSTLKGVLPVRRCGGWPVRNGRPGPMTRRLLALFDALIHEETKAGSLPGSMRR